MGNVLVDDVLGRDDEVDIVDDEIVETPTDVIVCGHVDGDEVCGYSGTANQVRMHRMSKHRDRSKDKPRATKEKPPSRRKPAAKKTADMAAAPHTPRSTTYAGSLAMGASAAFIFIPPFDQYDLSICNAGIPNVASALDAVGQQNQTFQRTCDLILGGGGGAAYLQLVMALAGIVVPIAAHHGAFPAQAGVKFGEFVGVSSEPSAAPEPTGAGSTGEAATRGEGDDDTPTADDVIRIFTRTPETVMTDAMTRMMSGNGPTVVNVPTFAGEAADGERGSEQPNPERPSIPIP